MKNFFMLTPLVLLAACNGTELPDYEVISNELRAPAYPLVTIDPYTSAWSLADNLYDESVKHWTGADFPLLGVLMVDGEPYRFMGTEDVELTVIVPSSERGPWEARYTTDEPAADWTAPEFDDAAWESGVGAFGTRENERTARTQWGSERIWVRRTVTIDEDPTGKAIFLEYSDDDQIVLWINGVQVHDSGFAVHQNRRVRLSDEAAAALKQGENVIAASGYNPHGNGLLDFGLLTPKVATSEFATTAVQTSADVQATQTHYTFTCGPVDLALTFTSPLLMDDLDIMSRPVNYITYKVTSTDGASHDVKLYLEASPRWALNRPVQESESESFTDGDLVFVKSGSKEQNVLGRRGDDVRIDWGYFYMAGEGKNTAAAVGESADLRSAFVSGTPLTATNGENTASNMSLTTDLGSVKSASGKVLIGYDDIYSIQYFEENLRPWWNRASDKTILGEFHAANSEYADLMGECYRFDAELMTNATAAGGEQYAELCALAYRQSIAAHKLVEAPNGDPLWLSKENNSNGSIGTVDVTYPSAPLYLYYNAELAKGLLNHIFYYSESGKWTKPFAAHDVGTYPLANGQTYGGDMPIEESGNMVILTAAIAEVEGNADYAAKHWETLTTWTDYLVEYGLDPENQLCTDDFAGHFAHNINLSVKAIMGVASYGRLAEMLGKADVAEKYTAKAQEMAAEWVKMADDGDHYRLTFDKPGTWSQKYNLVWDKLMNFNLFPAEVAQTEIAYYLTKQNEYGLPLDNRETYTKIDWIAWTATLADDKATFEKFIAPVWKFENETTSRVPMSDWIWTDRPAFRGFKARSVVGGFWIKMLEDKLADTE
jgi:hypothetical protein